MNDSNFKRQVVIVEDNPADLKLIEIAIEGVLSSEYQLVFLNDGDELLKYLEDEGKEATIDIVIMDYNMPKMNAREVLVELKDDEIEYEFPIVIFSSSNNFSDIQSCYALGANAYVVKPIDFDIFENRLFRIINFWVTPITVNA